METVFLKILNMGIAAGWLILVVLVLRLALRRAPKWVCFLMWSLVGLRLLLPVSLESVLSLIPSAETVSPEILFSDAPTIYSGVGLLNSTVNPILSESMAPRPENSVNPMQVLVGAASWTWLAGVLVMMVLAVWGTLSLKRRIGTAVLLRDNVWQSEAVASPFVFGLVRPRIYVPFGMPEEPLAHVLAHEQAHIVRRDHWIKPLGYLLLTAYWFHPLVWLAYVLLSRDIELACDERVVKTLGLKERKAYAQTLLACSVPRGMITACPLAFGEACVETRIRNVLNHRKPAFWILIVSMLLSVFLAVCFLTNPKRVALFAPEPFGHSYRVEAVVYDAPQFSFTYTPDTAPIYCLTADYAMLAREWHQQEWRSLGSAVRTTLTPSLFDGGFLPADGISGWHDPDESAEILRRNNRRAWMTVDDRMVYLVMRQKDGNVYLAVGYRASDGDATPSYRWVFRLTRLEEEAGAMDSQDHRSLPDEPVIGTEAEDMAIKSESAYVTVRCLFLNPLSSTLAQGDNGLRYLVGEEGIRVTDRRTGELLDEAVDVHGAWKALSLQEWESFFPMGGAPETSWFQPVRMRAFSDRLWLFEVQGEYWIGQNYRDKIGLWSVFALAPESASPVTWTYSPLLSSRYPAFRFRFKSGDTLLEAGVLSITAAGEEQAGLSSYRAVLTAGQGLSLTAAPDGEGAFISSD